MFVSNANNRNYVEEILISVTWWLYVFDGFPDALMKSGCQKQTGETEREV